MVVASDGDRLGAGEGQSDVVDAAPPAVGLRSASSNLTAGARPSMAPSRSSATVRPRTGQTLRRRPQKIGLAVDSVRTQVLERVPLTATQVAMWLAQKLGAADANLNLGEAVEIEGPVDACLFIASLYQLTKEAETTRCVVEETADGPRFVIHPEYQRDIPFVDMSAAADPMAEARAWMMRDIDTLLDIERDPLWFSALIKLSADRYLWFHRAHHLVLDGYSCGLLVRRLADIYNAKLAGREPPKTPFGRMSALVAEEEEYRRSKAFEKDRAYWRQYTADLPEPATLAQGRVAGAPGFARQSGPFSLKDSAQIRELARNLGCSTPTLLISLAAAFFHRTSGTRDVVFGMPVSARGKVGRSVPALVANAVLLRVQIAPEQQLSDLIDQTARAIRGGLRRQLYPLNSVRRDAGLSGDDQLFRLAVNIEPFDYQHDFGGHPIRVHNLRNFAIGDLVVFVYDRGEKFGLHVDFDANPTLYAPQDLAAHMRRFQRLVRALLDDPSQKIGDVDLLTDDERTRLARWNATDHPYEDESVVAQFERQAALTPDAPAVAFGSKLLCYRDLQRRVDALAEALLERGAKPGDVAALILPRSEWTIAGMLGAMRAGAAFLPIDPDAPASRIAFALADAGAKWIVTEGAIAGALPLPQISRIAVGSLPVAADRQPPASSARQSDPAYVIYTSGSTGTPKGVVVSRGNLTSMFAAMEEHLVFKPGDRLLAVIASTFDPMIMECLTPLLKGATVTVAPSEIVRDPHRLAEMMHRSRVTHMQATPPLWNALIDTRLALFGGVVAMAGGDVLAPHTARRLRDLGARVFNFYGPTETTIWSTVAEIVDDGPGTVTIGRPIRNTRIHILDDRMRPVPPGLVGEICIAGPGVAQGYLNRPELTADRFPPDPFGAPGERLYRTGDLGRFRPDGRIEFLGRRDFQLKIRGYRIEPGEIEAALMACDGVAQAVVVAVVDRKGAKRLAAYIEPKHGASIDPAGLSARLGETLPEYMIPAHIALLEKMPLTPSGKIDRRSLPKPEASNRAAYVAPRTATETRLAAMFAAMLGIDRVGVETDFFSMGADSLTAVQFLAAIEAEFCVQPSLISLFESPTIASLAKQIDNREAADPYAPLIPIRRAGDERPLFCVHSVNGLSWGYAGLLRHLNPRTPVYGLQSYGFAPGQTPIHSIAGMAERYLADIREVQPSGPYRLLGWSLGGLVAFAMTERLESAGEQVELLTLLDAYPGAERDGEPVDDESLTAEVLEFLDYVGDRAPQGVRNLDDLAEFALKEVDVFSLPIFKKSGLLARPDLKPAYRRVLVSNARAIRDWRPGLVAARTLVIRASDGKDISPYKLVDHRPGVWRAYCSGDFEEHEVFCQHHAVLNPEALEDIGPILRAALG
jgi:enterobactin synthetase component F